MELTDLQKRLNDLDGRCQKSGSPTSSVFLTPAEVAENRKYYPDAVFSGGYDDAERQIAIFLPEWMDKEDVDIAEYISCIEVQSYFGTPGHRDYLGAILGLGLSRDRIGDIIIDNDSAYVFCLNSVAGMILSDLNKAGNITVKTKEVSVYYVPEFRIRTRKVCFTVKSMRLDAVVSDMFGISRTKAAVAIREGYISLNYSNNVQCDTDVAEKDVISFRGKGKGKIAEVGGKSKKDRIFVTAEVYI